MIIMFFAVTEITDKFIGYDWNYKKGVYFK